MVAFRLLNFIATNTSDLLTACNKRTSEIEPIKKFVICLQISYRCWNKCRDYILRRWIPFSFKRAAFFESFSTLNLVLTYFLLI